jgi:hypothetical protein
MTIQLNENSQFKKEANKIIFISIFLMVTIMIMAFIFNSILAIWLGWYQYLVILSTVILIFWLAQLRLLKIAQRPIGTLEKIIETHLLMDKAIDEQLQVISFDINQRYC